MVASGSPAGLPRSIPHLKPLIHQSILVSSYLVPCSVVFRLAHGGLRFSPIKRVASPMPLRASASLLFLLLFFITLSCITFSQNLVLLRGGQGHGVPNDATHDAKYRWENSASTPFLLRKVSSELVSSCLTFLFLSLSLSLPPSLPPSLLTSPAPL